MKQETHCVSSLMEYKISLPLKETPVILNSSRISLEDLAKKYIV